MILDGQKPEDLLASQPQSQPPSTMTTNDLPSYSVNSAPSSSSRPSETKQLPSSSLPLPLLLPPLYAPSPSSPFLVAFPPSLDEDTFPPLSFLALIKAINSSLEPTPVVRSARTAENVISHVPGLNLGYRIAKWALGGLTLGILRGGVSVLEGGKAEGKASRSIGKVSSTGFRWSLFGPSDSAEALVQALPDP